MTQHHRTSPAQSAEAALAHIKPQAAARGRPLSGAETALLRYIGVVEHLGIWDLLDPDRFDWFDADLAERYPERRVLPLLKCGGNDDVICLSLHDPASGARFIVIHGWASPGWEVTLRADALREAIELHRGWCEDLPAGLQA